MLCLKSWATSSLRGENMKPEKIRPIPQYILSKIEKKDRKLYPQQNGFLRFYSYLTKISKELVKITIAVKNYRKVWYCKQVAVHGVHSDKCLVKDMEYNYMGMGYRVGWHAEGLTKYKKWFESPDWGHAECKYYNPYSTLINIEYISKFSEYRYSAYNQFQGKCVIEYLRLYAKYPQTEYLLKLGLNNLVFSKIILNQISKDRKFCKWLVFNKDTLKSGYYYKNVIILAYKSGKSMKIIQEFEMRKKQLIHDSDLKPIREMFKGKALEKFFTYIDGQKSNPRSYRDYLIACNYLGLDMTLDKNRFPHDFKRWHDIRIDEMNTAKALADKQAKQEMNKQFTTVAEKYLALQNCKNTDYKVFIARSIDELIQEGELLEHCVGRMNYDQKMIREETLIFFVRNTETPDIPFVTVEYSLKSKKVLQCYGINDSKPEEPVLNYVNKIWLPHANRTIKKLAA